MYEKSPFQFHPTDCSESSSRLDIASYWAFRPRVQWPPLMELLGGFAMAAALWYGSRQIAAGSLTTGEFTSFIAALFLMYGPAKKLSRANANFQQLASELSDLENKIAASRRFFNNAVQEYNTGIQQMPAALFAGMFGFTHKEFFDLGASRTEVEAAPQVKF